MTTTIAILQLKCIQNADNLLGEYTKKSRQINTAILVL